MDTRLSSARRSPTLDLLRFLAIALVLGRHAWVCPLRASSGWHWITDVYHRGGWIGVDLFFVLSGFLIAGLLFQESQSHGRISLSRFFLRRGFKIYPAFWALILFTILLSIYDYRGIETRSVSRWMVWWTLISKWLFSEVLFIQNYASAAWGYTWSLAVEEHFYLVLPLLLLLMRKLRRRDENPFSMLPLVFGVVALGCLLGRLLSAAAGDFSVKRNFMPTHLRIDSLLFGVLLSYWHHYCRTKFHGFAQRYGSLCIAAGVCLWLPAFVWEVERTPYLYTLGFTQLYLGSGLLLVGFLGKGTGQSTFGHSLALIGSRSYSIYLWHGPAAWLASQRFDPTIDFVNWYSWASTYFASALLLGMGMAAMIEYPVLRLRDRYFPSRSHGGGSGEPIGGLVTASPEVRELREPRPTTANDLSGGRCERTSG